MRDLSDPISRQQAITALRALSDEDGYINAPHEVVTDVVRGLPPVKAKQGQTTRSEQPKKDKLGVKTGETYKDTISRQAAIDGVKTLHDVAWKNWHEPTLSANAVLDMIKQLPPAQPERKKGKWIDDSIFGQLPVIVCDQCKTFFPLQFGDSHNFCPNCGADMRQRGEQDG